MRRAYVKSMDWTVGDGYRLSFNAFTGRVEVSGLTDAQMAILGWPEPGNEVDIDVLDELLNQRPAKCRKCGQEAKYVEQNVNIATDEPYSVYVCEKGHMTFLFHGNREKKPVMQGRKPIILMVNQHGFHEHDTMKAAEEEAERLARQLGGTAVVYVPVLRVTKQDLVKERVERPEFDYLPF